MEIHGRNRMMAVMGSDFHSSKCTAIVCTGEHGGKWEQEQRHHQCYHCPQELHDSSFLRRSGQPQHALSLHKPLCCSLCLELGGGPPTGHLPPQLPWMRISLPRHDLLGEERWPISQRRRAKSLFLNGLLLGSICTEIQVKLINHCQSVRVKQ